MRYTIHNDKLTVAVDSLGAELASITDANGLEYLWQGDPAHWRGRAPILFPYVGQLRNDRAESAQGVISGERHGFARRSEWELKEISESSVTLQLTDNACTREQYPYAFSFRLTYALEGDTLHQIYTVHNPGEAALPYCLGAHPAFNVPLLPEEQFEDYTITFDQPETVDCPRLDAVTGLVTSRCDRLLTERDRFSLNHLLFRGDALVLEDLRSRLVKLSSAVSGHGVELAFDGWDVLGIWSAANDAPFVCLEPWTGTATRDMEDDVFEHKRGVTVLPAGETAEKRFSMRFF